MIPSDQTRSTAEAKGMRVCDSPAIGALILHELEHHGPCTIETLTTSLPYCSWNQLFMAIDSLSREGALLLQLQARSQYLVSLAAPRTDTFPPVVQARITEATDAMACNAPRGMKEAGS